MCTWFNDNVVTFEVKQAFFLDRSIFHNANSVSSQKYSKSACSVATLNGPDFLCPLNIEKYTNFINISYFHSILSVFSSPVSMRLQAQFDCSFFSKIKACQRTQLFWICLHVTTLLKPHLELISMYLFPCVGYIVKEKV